VRKNILQAMIGQAILDAATPANIKTGFRACGQMPFKPNFAEANKERLTREVFNDIFLSLYPQPSSFRACFSLSPNRIGQAER